MLSPLASRRGSLSPLASGLATTGTAPAFAPTSLPGLVLWLDPSDASSVVLNGPNVSTWRDKSGLGNDAAQSAFAPSQVPYQVAGLNGLNVLAPAPSSPNQYLNFTSNPTAGASAATFFWISQNAASDDGPSAVAACPLEGFGSSGLTDHHPYQGTIYNGLGSSSRYQVGTGYSSIESPHIWSVASGPGSWSMAEDGAPLGPATVGNTFGAASSSPTIAGNPNYPWSGLIGEIVVVGRLLTSTETTQILAYLKARWGTP